LPFIVNSDWFVFLYSLFKRKYKSLQIVDKNKAFITTYNHEGKEVGFLSPIFISANNITVKLYNEEQIIPIITIHDKSEFIFIGLPISASQLGFNYINIYITNYPDDGKSVTYVYYNDEKIDWNDILVTVKNNNDQIIGYDD
jgi:hypothetical protein